MNGNKYTSISIMLLLIAVCFTGCVKTKFLLTNSGIYAGDGNDNTKWTLVQRVDIKG